MAEYTAQWRYASSYGRFDEGDTVSLEEERAAIINRDSPGVLVLVPGAQVPDAEGRVMSGPPHDRAMTGAETTTRAQRLTVTVTDPEEVDATEAAKKLAAQNGVDLSDVTGSGVGGRITKGDVEKALE